ncbi:Wzz/FepE/Etk N-terminal domain-containing protein [Enterococcus rivorum]
MTLTIFGIKGEYKSTVQVIVRQNFEGETIQNTEVQANVQLVNTYNEIIKSPFILEKVSDQIDKKFDVLQLRRMIKVTNATNSQVINISILANNPKTSSELANLVAETFKDNAAKAIKIDSVTILSKSEYDTVSTRKKKSVYFLIVFSLSLLILVGIVILIAVSDTTLKVEEDIINGLNLAVLGSVVKIVPREPEKKEKRGKDGRRRRKKS